MRTAMLVALVGALVAFGLRSFHLLAPTNMAPQMLLIGGMILALLDLINTSDRKY
jgi:hypothetical protein